MNSRKGLIFSVKITDSRKIKEQDDEYVVKLAFEWEVNRYHSAFIFSYDKFQNWKTKDCLKE